MPGSKGRRNRRDRERERRRSREPEAIGDEERAEAAAARADERVAARAATPPSRGGASTDLPLPGPGVRITGLMVGIITTLGAAYMVIAGTLNGSGADSILSIGAGVVMLGIGAFVVALVLFPAQIRNFVRRGN
jgi:hypothetical protein